MPSLSLVLLSLMPLAGADAQAANPVGTANRQLRAARPFGHGACPRKTGRTRRPSWSSFWAWSVPSPSSTARGWRSWPRGTKRRAWRSSASTPTSRTRWPRSATSPASRRSTFPMLKDPGNAVADQFGAKRTPEAFVLDGKGSRALLGPDRRSVRRRLCPHCSRRRNFVASALDELLAGKAVSQPSTEPVGCFIGRVQRTKPTGDVTYTKHIAAHPAPALRPLPPAGRDRAVRADRLRRSVGLGRDDPRSDRRRPHAAVARQPRARQVLQRRPPASDDEKQLDPHVGRQRLPAGRSGRPARAAAVRRRLADSQAGRRL